MIFPPAAVCQQRYLGKSVVFMLTPANRPKNRPKI
jgi:hypothetical protein